MSQQEKLLIELIAEENTTTTSASASATSTSPSKSRSADQQIVAISLDTLMIDLLIPRSQAKALARIIDPLTAAMIRGVKGVPLVLPVGLLSPDTDTVIKYLKTLRLDVPDTTVKLPYLVEYKGKEIVLDSKSVVLLTNGLYKPTKLLSKTLVLANKLASLSKFAIKTNLTLAHLLPSPLNTLRVN